MREALALYGRALSGAAAASGPAGPLVRYDDGALRPFPVGRFLAAADHLDELLMERVEGPVLDVGCGPGRHLRALRARGVYGLGIDLSPVAVALARANGARAIVADVFGELPRIGSWRTALLLDGNIGIGGDPVCLLMRLGELLDDGGVVLVELEPPGSETAAAHARIELAGESSGWFPWARLTVNEVADVAAEAGFSTEREWSCGARWFAWLRPDACA